MNARILLVFALCSTLFAADPPISDHVEVRLTARSQGGKSRYEPWATDYGSYQRTDTSSRQMVCSVAAVVNREQTMRAQCYVITRNLDARDIELKPIADLVITVPAKSTKTISAISVVQGTDDNYAALGIRDRTGDKYLGWTWRILDINDHVVAITSSQSGYDHYAKDAPVTAAKK